MERGHALQHAARPAGQAGQGGACGPPAAFPIEFTTIAVSDGISMGHEGMRASLVPRGDRRLGRDGDARRAARRLVTFAGCDKSLPGMLMAAARLNLPSGLRLRRIDPAGPPQRPGARHRVGVRGRGRPRRRALSDAELDAIERNACPTEGSCAGMFTANTMASVGEALGMSLPGSASAPPSTAAATTSPTPRPGRRRPAAPGHPPPPDPDQEAFENAIAVVMALGGSTNAVLHLLAIAAEARVELALEDFNRVAGRVPHIADTKPAGKYHMSDIDRIGGVPVVMQHLLEAGLLHGDCLTVTGQTVAENLATSTRPSPTARSSTRSTGPSTPSAASPC